MKFFSLINEQTVREAPNVKVIPKEEFSTLVEANELLAQAKHEVEEYKKQVHQESEELKKQAFEEGFEEGLKKFNEKVLKLNQQMTQLREEVQKKIVPLSLHAARKILGEELKLNPNRIVDIVKQALKPVTQHKRIVIYVNKNDLKILIEQKKELLDSLEQAEAFSIKERSDIEPGGCVIETEVGIINAQLEIQWRALEAAFASFLKNR